jgi:hypothetical protein
MMKDRIVKMQLISLRIQSEVCLVQELQASDLDHHILLALLSNPLTHLSTLHLENRDRRKQLQLNR